MFWSTPLHLVNITPTPSSTAPSWVTYTLWSEVVFGCSCNSSIEHLVSILKKEALLTKIHWQTFVSEVSPRLSILNTICFQQSVLTGDTWTTNLVSVLIERNKEGGIKCSRQNSKMEILCFPVNLKLEIKFGKVCNL